jgi:hypothetical protein
MVELAKELNITQKSAWLFHIKIQQAMASSGKHLLTGEVHIDEFITGGPEPTNSHKPTVHIVTVQKGNKSPLDSEVFIDTYRTLSQELHYPVTYKVSVGNNIAKNILKYAQK